MQTVGEIPQAPYAAIVRTLLGAGARVPERSRDGAHEFGPMIEDLLTGSGA
jgi:hypothetical protein